MIWCMVGNVNFVIGPAKVIKQGIIFLQNSKVPTVQNLEETNGEVTKNEAVS